MVCFVCILICGCRIDFNSDVLPDTDGNTSPEQSENMGNDSGDSTIHNNEPSPSPALPVSYVTMYVNLKQYGSKLNVRDNPSIDGNIIGKLDHGESVEVAWEENGWAVIKYDGNGGIGYISSDYLVQEEPSELMPPIIDGSPGEVYLNVYKEKRILELWSNNGLIGEYNIGLGFNPIGHKEKEGDGRTPEGSYYVCVRNPNSRFYLSLGVSYPGISDAERGLESGLITQDEYNSIVNAINNGGLPPWNTALGGQIMIHGSGGSYDWTEGCIAVDDNVMDILWEHCPIGTKINIYP